MEPLMSKGFMEQVKVKFHKAGEIDSQILEPAAQSFRAGKGTEDSYEKDIYHNDQQCIVCDTGSFWSASADAG